MRQMFGLGNGDKRDSLGWLLVVAVFVALLVAAKNFDAIAIVLNFFVGCLALLFLIDNPKGFEGSYGDVFLLLLGTAGVLSPILVIWNPLAFPVVGVSVANGVLFFLAVFAYIRDMPTDDKGA